eukprot:TRINITY_DN60747_c0_g1_i1.p1 TRINITY_DN60747_c0_g1~~TRINITY_DN60747_c0_g1_i1.p1  ORF type:complete len:423 (+),score=58.77 TRINITY_DN60747_c0_g1_i1:81-1271(+)
MEMEDAIAAVNFGPIVEESFTEDPAQGIDGDLQLMQSSCNFTDACRVGLRRPLAPASKMTGPFLPEIGAVVMPYLLTRIHLPIKTEYSPPREDKEAVTACGACVGTLRVRGTACPVCELRGADTAVELPRIPLKRLPIHSWEGMPAWLNVRKPDPAAAGPKAGAKALKVGARLAGTRARQAQPDAAEQGDGMDARQLTRGASGSTVALDPAASLPLSSPVPPPSRSASRRGSALSPVAPQERRPSRLLGLDELAQTLPQSPPSRRGSAASPASRRQSTAMPTPQGVSRGPSGIVGPRQASGRVPSSAKASPTVELSPVFPGLPSLASGTGMKRGVVTALSAFAGLMPQGSVSPPSPGKAKIQAALAIASPGAGKSAKPPQGKKGGKQNKPAPKKKR